MILSTERLVLRPLELRDADAFFEMRSSPENSQYLTRPRPETIDDATWEVQRLLGLIAKGSTIGWAITLTDDDKLMGTIGLPRIDREHRQSSIAFELSRTAWGKGYVREAIAPVLRYGFDALALHRIQGEVDPRNARSLRVLESAGFRREGLLRENEWSNDQFVDTVIFSLLASDPWVFT